MKRPFKAEYEKIFIIRSEKYPEYDGVMFHSKSELNNFADARHIGLKLKKTGVN